MDNRRLDSIFSALSDPTRRDILMILSRGPLSVNDLARPFDISLPAISRHLKVLERAGLITRSREGQVRPCRIAPEGLKVAASWLEEYRELWDARLDRMESYLESLKASRENPDEERPDEGQGTRKGR